MSRAWTCRGRLRSPGRGSFSTGGAGRGWRGTGQAPAPGNARGGGWARGAGLSYVPAPGNRSGVLSRAAPAPRPHPGTPPLGIRARAKEEVGDPSPTTEPQPPAVPLQVARPQGQRSSARSCSRVAWAGPPEGPGRSARCCTPASGLSEQPRAGRGQWAGHRGWAGQRLWAAPPRLPLPQRRPAPALQLRKCPQRARG